MREVEMQEVGAEANVHPSEESTQKVVEVEAKEEGKNESNPQGINKDEEKDPATLKKEQEELAKKKRVDDLMAKLDRHDEVEKEAKKEKMEKAKRGVTALIQLSWTLIKSFDFVWIILALLFSAVNGLIPIMFYYIFGDIMSVIQDAAGDNAKIKAGINDLALKLLMVAIGSGLSQFFYQLFSGIVQTRIGTLLRKKYFGRLVDQEMGFFDKAKTGKLMSDLSEGVTSVETAYSTSIPKVFEQVATGGVGIVLAFIHSWVMSLFLLAAAPILLIIMFVVGSVSQVFVGLLQKESDKASAHVTEVVSAMKTVRTMGGEEKEIRDYKKTIRKMDIINILASLFQGVAFGVIFFGIWALCAYGFWIGGILVIDGMGDHKIEFGDMMKVFGFMLIGVMGVAMSIPHLAQVGKALIQNQSIWDVILREPKINTTGGIQIDNFKGKIEFKNVTFAYPTHPNTLVLKNFSYTFQPGQKVALVGHSGSGKSTIISLIARFYDPIDGEIFVDDVPLKDLDPVWFHRMLGMVTQEPVLFQDSIENNIKYSTAKSMRSADMNAISHDQVVDAAEAANAHGFIMDQIKQYKTMIGERGTSLSGGQKQRVAIARAVLQDPNILLLDEATSALDTESEKLVQASLDKLMTLRNRTTIAIAHRLSTIQDSDEILAFEDGELLERGTHDELIAMNGLYYNLASKQMAFGQDSDNSESSEKKQQSVAEDSPARDSQVEVVVDNNSEEPSVNVVHVEESSEATPGVDPSALEGFIENLNETGEEEVVGEDIQEVQGEQDDSNN